MVMVMVMFGYERMNGDYLDCIAALMQHVAAQMTARHVVLAMIV
jgi:hypothetical protein